MMQIGDLAAKAGITTRTIRYYEELGIIEPDERTEGGFRLYSDRQHRRLTIVQGLKALGFELERIRELFALRAAAKTGGELAQAMSQHLREQQEEIAAKILHYEEMRQRNERALQVLSGCLRCSAQLAESDCHECEIFRQHPDVRDMVECSVYELAR
jgi:DNA-binding transcriptional MerR regulator